jgi:ribosomal protein L16 Arg81 hydroxylase
MFQAVGNKHVVLFPETQTPFVAAFEEGILTNTSQIDLEQSEEEILKKFPDFGSAQGFECILMPGDLLYIPPNCWHFVKSLSTSFSVSFWFK